MPDRYSTKIDILNRVYVDLRDTLDWLKNTPSEYEDGSKEEEFIGILENILSYTVPLAPKDHLKNGDIDTHYEIVKMFVNKLSERRYMITQKLINGTSWGVSDVGASEESQIWVATETLGMVGGEFQIGDEGITYNRGTASVVFSRQGSGEFFMAEYDVLSKASKGIFISLGTSSTITGYTATFNDVPTASAKVEEYIKLSFTGGFRTTGFSGGAGIMSVGFGKTVTIDPATGEVNEDAWSGKADTISFGFGIDFSVGVVESVYKLKGDTWENVAEHFTLGK